MPRSRRENDVRYARMKREDSELSNQGASQAKSGMSRDSSSFIISMSTREGGPPLRPGAAVAPIGNANTSVHRSKRGSSKHSNVPFRYADGADAADHSDYASAFYRPSTAGTSQTETNQWKKWREKAKIVIPHIGLIMISCLYAILGGTLFYTIEGPEEDRMKAVGLNEINKLREKIAGDMWKMRRDDVTEDDWNNKVYSNLEDFMEILLTERKQSFLTVKEVRTNQTERRWNFHNAVFFSATVITTIGYGDLVPRTSWGQIICVLYGMFGIPLLLVTVADLGKFLAEFLVWCNKMYRKAGSLISSTVVDLIRKTRSVKPEDDVELDQATSRASTSKQVTISKDITTGNTTTSETFIAEPIDMDEFQISLVFVLGMLFGYTGFSAFAFTLWENWTFLESFYFSFITVTTIGFGDIVPLNSSYIYLSLTFIIVGLVITTMCIDLVGSQYLSRIHYVGRNIAQAKNALALVGGKVFQFGDVLRCAAILQRKYGLTPEEIERLARYSDAYLMEALLHGRPLPGYFRALLLSLRPFIPRDIACIRYIDKKLSGSLVSQTERRYASLESLDVTSKMSTAAAAKQYAKDLKNFYPWWDQEYNTRW